MSKSPPYLKDARAMLEIVRSDRRHIHAHPELSFEEKETAAYVSDRLTDIGIEHKTGIGGHGIVAHIGDPGKGKIIALRADMDALPISELNEVSYASTKEGVMHACGHDVHTACLLGAARLLKANEKELGGAVRLLFQPAEERLPGGATLMIADGALERPDVEMIVGQHVYPDMETGHVGFRPGMYMASTDELYITVKGRGGHAALPHKNIDPVLMAAHLITAVQQLVSRRAYAATPTVVSFGKVTAGGATNVIPDEVYLEGTVRTMDETWRAELHGHLRRLAEGLCQAMGGSAEVEIRRGYPCLTNDPEVTERARKTAERVLGADKVHALDLRMTAEDFAWYAQKVPACFYRLGTSNKAKNIGAPLHTGRFDIDEDALITGSALMAAIATDLLGGEGS